MHRFMFEQDGNIYRKPERSTQKHQKYSLSNTSQRLVRVARFFSYHFVMGGSITPHRGAGMRPPTWMQPGTNVLLNDRLDTAKECRI